MYHQVIQEQVDDKTSTKTCQEDKGKEKAQEEPTQQAKDKEERLKIEHHQTTKDRKQVEKYIRMGDIMITTYQGNTSSEE